MLRKFHAFLAVGQIACILFLVACVLWSQLLYPMALNSKTLFEAIIDSNDQTALGSTYNKWLLGLFSDEVRVFMLLTKNPSCINLINLRGTRDGKCVEKNERK